MKPLTQAEVEALAEGTEVWVKWSGGNGPHRYLIARRYGMTCAETDFSVGNVAHPLDMCGEHPLIQVWTSDPCATHPIGGDASR